MNTYDIEQGSFGAAGLTPKQLQAVSETTNGILGNLTKAWAALSARAILAKSEAKAEIAKVKTAIDALQAIRPQDEAGVGAWGKAAADLQSRLHGLAIGLADAPLAKAIEGMDPLADLDAALGGGGLAKWLLIPAVAGLGWFLWRRYSKAHKGMMNAFEELEEYEPEGDLD